VMNFGWQDASALTLVAVAAAYVVTLALGSTRMQRKTACGGGCAKCPSSAVAEPSHELPSHELVQIGGLGAGSQAVGR
jgi:hypothetical protein